MKQLRRLWEAIETGQGLRGVRQELANRFGPEWTLIKGFCKATGSRSETFPCPSPGGEGCPRRVVSLPNGSLLAVCGCNPKECDHVELRPEDVAVHNLDLGRLCRKLNELLGISGSPKVAPEKNAIWAMGSIRTAQVRRLPVLLTLAGSRDGMSASVDYLLTAFPAGFTLLTPTERFVDVVLEQRLSNASAFWASLQDTVYFNGRKLCAVAKLQRIVSEVQPRRKTAPAPEEPAGGGRLELPPDAQWSDITIRFLDGHTLSIIAGSRQQRRTFAEMGMVDRRSGNPNRQWKLLQHMAGHDGRLSWQTPGADLKLKKQVQLLARRLQQHFGIQDWPFHEYQKGVGWRIKLKLEVAR